MRNCILWSNAVFEKEVIFHKFGFKITDLEFVVSKSSIWKHTTLCNKGVFSLIIISQLWKPVELKCSQVCYFMHNVEIHQVSRQVFDNYQYCPMSLSSCMKLCRPGIFPKVCSRLHNLCSWIVVVLRWTSGLTSQNHDNSQREIMGVVSLQTSLDCIPNTQSLKSYLTSKGNVKFNFVMCDL